ncbi:MAG: DUF4837 family protein, partial [Bacteroidales bacterium]|nr:DUF4837 family protein [Bacteroidales bacterium]
MKKHLFLFLVATLFAFAACNEPQQRIARSVGATSEILVVVQNPQQWQGAEGDAIRDFFGQDQIGLTQSEPLFRLSNINVDNLSDMFKKHRNMLVVEINPKLKDAMVETRSDLWAKPQRVIKITAPDATSWIEAFDSNKEGFKLLYDRSERERLLNIFRPTANVKVMEPVLKTFDIKLLIPEGFYIAKNEADFMWIRKEANDFSQALIIYTTPYLDTTDLNSYKVISRRDLLVQQ